MTKHIFPVINPFGLDQLGPNEFSFGHLTVRRNQRMLFQDTSWNYILTSYQLRIVS